MRIWTQETDQILKKLVAEHGRKWAHIQKSLPYTSQSAARNRWIRIKDKTQNEKSEVVILYN